jgi:predicted nucleic-acid-binding Zn-ribbon protein
VRVVCFSPNDAVWRWSLPQAQFLEALRQRGDEIIYIYCDREYSSFCMSMASSGIRFSDSADAKKAVCDKCVQQAKLVRTELNFTGRPLRSFLKVEDIEYADRLCRERQLEELYDHVEDGLSVGRLALYETIIQTKSISKKLSLESEGFYRSSFRNTLISVRASKAMLDELKPDVGISYHTAYAYNRAFQRVFEAGNVPVWFLNASLTSRNKIHILSSRGRIRNFFSANC